MPNSFLRRSARKGPTPFKYSIDELNMEDDVLMLQISVRNNQMQTAYSNSNVIFLSLMLRIKL